MRYKGFVWRKAPAGKEDWPSGKQPEYVPRSPASLNTAWHLGERAFAGLFTKESAQETEVGIFDRLRSDTHAGMRSEYATRMALDPTPTPQERAFGMYAENLEPQVRNAIFSMRAKGYQTRGSGFFHGDVSWRILGIEGEDVPRGTYAATTDPVHKRAQVMDVRCDPGFRFDNTTTEQVHGLGAEIIYHPQGDAWRIGFVPQNPDITQITATWDAIALALPDTGAPVPSAETFRGDFFDWGASTY
jgi:hypothetical protein